MRIGNNSIIRNWYTYVLLQMWLCCEQMDEEASLWSPRPSSSEPEAEEQTLRSDGTEMEGQKDLLQVLIHL